MANKILQLFAIDTLIMFVENFLTSTVKNPNSPGASRVYSIVQRLNKATDDYLKTVPPPRL